MQVLVKQGFLKLMIKTLLTFKNCVSALQEPGCRVWIELKQVC